MRVLCISGSRADYGGIDAVYRALIKRNVQADLKDASAIWTDYDLVVLLGDRFEVLKVAVDYYINKIPIAHLSGGDITEGSLDNSMRHAITQLAHLHFPTNEGSAKRIIQMGVEPWRVHAAGYPGIDNMELLDHPIIDDYILLVWHPNTLVSEGEALLEAHIVANAMEVVRGKNKVVVIEPNNDVGGESIAKFFMQWAEFTGNYYWNTKPRKEYLTLLKYAKCLVGNSSSGFYEAPSFGTPTVNIGDRQNGRMIPPGMTCAAIEMNDIIEASHIAMTMSCEYERGKLAVNVYAKGNAADKIAEVIANIKDPKTLLRKKFYDL